VHQLIQSVQSNPSSSTITFPQFVHFVQILDNAINLADEAEEEAEEEAEVMEEEELLKEYLKPSTIPSAMPSARPSGKSINEQQQGMVDDEDDTKGIDDCTDEDFQQLYESLKGEDLVSIS